MDIINGVLLLDSEQLRALPTKPLPMQPPNQDIPIWVLAKDSVELPDWVQRVNNIGDFLKMLDSNSQLAIPDVADKTNALSVQRKLERARNRRWEKQNEAIKVLKEMDKNWKWPKNRKPRVFCYASRFSSVMQHQARGLLKGFEKIGCETRSLTEDSSIHRVYSGSGEYEFCLPMLEAIIDFNPDLILSINYYRNADLYGINRPVYTWIQDRVANLNKHSAEQIGDRDYIGLLSSGLMDRWAAEGFPVNRMRLHPAGYDGDIFYPPEDNNLREGIVYVEQNAAQTPYQAFKEMASQFQGLIPLLTELFCRSSDIFSLGHDMFESDYAKMFDQILNDYRAMGQINNAIEGCLRNNLLYMFYHNVGNRWMRQRPLSELVSVGAPIKIYGKHWESNHVLAPAAGGALASYEDVANIYRKAKIVLNVQHECTMIHRTVEGLACGAHVLCKALAQDFEPANRHVICGWFDRPGEVVPACREMMNMPNPAPEDTKVQNYEFAVQAKTIFDWIDGEMRDKN